MVLKAPPWKAIFQKVTTPISSTTFNDDDVVPAQVVLIEFIVGEWHGFRVVKCQGVRLNRACG